MIQQVNCNHNWTQEQWTHVVSVPSPFHWIHEPSPENRLPNSEQVFPTLTNPINITPPQVMLRCQTPRWLSISSNTRESIIIGKGSSIFKIEKYLQKIMAPMTCRINMDWNDTQPLCTQSYFSYEDLLTSISLQNQTHNSKIKRIQQIQMTFPQLDLQIGMNFFKKI